MVFGLAISLHLRVRLEYCKYYEYLFNTYFELRDQVIQSALAVIFPMFLISGVLWPSVSMPIWLQWVASLMPVTHACQAVHHIVLRSSITAAMTAK